MIFFCIKRKICIPYDHGHDGLVVSKYERNSQHVDIKILPYIFWFGL